MAYDTHNLVSHTVRAKHRGPMRRANCAVGWAIQPWANGGRTWTWCHQWGKDERCLHCHKTVKEILMPYEEKYGPPELPAGSDAHLERALESGD